MDDEQIDKIISQVIRIGEVNQLILIRTEEIQKDIREIKVKLVMIELQPKVDAMVKNNLEQLASDLEIAVPTKKKSKKKVKN